MIVATAGHVDHGKTALIKALTGTDTDRLPEEKARGLSVDLGFAYQSLPNNSSIGFVDVPGHEKFIRNMLAGVAGIDLALLVVAADDGVMPQTLEHVAILSLLGIDQYVVAMTKIDRVGSNRVNEVQKQIKKLFGEIGHDEVDIYPVCAPSNEGIDVLKDTLHRLAKKKKEHEVDRFFRMAIDRVFTLKGVGLVVTGMVFSGATTVDGSLVVSSDGSQVRVRGIRMHNEGSAHALAGTRCALNIVGRRISEKTVTRGDWLMDASLYAPTRRIDVDMRVLGTETRGLKHWTPTHLHVGAAHVPARVAVLSGGSIAAGENGLAQLVLNRDAFVVHGDRFVLRNQSAQRTVAGGRVIDPFSPKRGRARPVRLAALRAKQHHEPADVLAALVNQSDVGVPLTQFSTSHNLPSHRADEIIEALALRRVGRSPQEWLFGEAQWMVLLARIEKTVGAINHSSPESAGPTLSEIQSAMRPHIATSVLDAALRSLASAMRLEMRGQRFHVPSHVMQFSEQDRQIWSRVYPMLAPTSGVPLTLHQAADELKIETRVLEVSLKNAVKIGDMVLVAKNRYVPKAFVLDLASAAEDLAVQSVKGLFTAAEYRNRTKMGRNFAIDLLEYFDRNGFTERIGNDRRVRRPACDVFAVDRRQW